MSSFVEAPTYVLLGRVFDARSSVQNTDVPGSFPQERRTVFEAQFLEPRAVCVCGSSPVFRDELKHTLYLSPNVCLWTESLSSFLLLFRLIRATPLGTQPCRRSYTDVHKGGDCSH